MTHHYVLIVLLLLCHTAQPCPDCSNWVGTVADVCGADGVTYVSDCELLVALCNDRTISMGAGMDVNMLPVSQIVAQYKMNDGACVNTGGGGNCPNCSAIVTMIPVCDSSLTEFDSSCSMAQRMCEDGIISYDDGVDFSVLTEQDYRTKISSYVYWNGKCSGPCPAGQFSNDGQYGPCVDCAPGSFAATTNSSSCELCPHDTYQPNSGATSCITCPSGKDTIDKGAADEALCLADCLPGHYSATGNAPCTQCAAGTYSDQPNALSCKSCGVGKFTDGQKCESCPVGSYSAATSAPASCTLCSEGSFSNVTGSSGCVQCAAGSFENSTGSSACDKCGEGTYNDVTGSTSCQQCDAGHYQIELGRSFCFKCTEGTYQPGQGSSSCLKCAKGYYQENEGATSCTKCPDRMTTMVEGSISQYDCHYTSCTPGNKVIIVADRVTCHACPAGYYQDRANVTYCSICPKNTYQATEGSTSCTRCPENSITYTTGSVSLDDCEGPMITLYTGANYQGTSQVLYDKRNDLASNLRGRIASFKVHKGDWYIFSSTWYSGTQLTLRQGVVRGDTSSSSQYPSIPGLSRSSFYSIRPVVTNSMCYIEYGLYYTGYRSKTRTGIVCQNWESDTPHSINPYSGQGLGNHNYCRNPDNDPNGPWCYTSDPNMKWDYCGIPKCKWNMACYTGIGTEYRGTKSQTAGGSYNCNNWYSNWPHIHYYDNDQNSKLYGVGRHSYCRNPEPDSDNRPWCYTTNLFKRWGYCDVPKCEYSSYSYF